MKNMKRLLLIVLAMSLLLCSCGKQPDTGDDVENPDVSTSEGTQDTTDGVTEDTGVEGDGSTDTQVPGSTDTQTPGSTDTQVPGSTDTQTPGSTGTQGTTTGQPGVGTTTTTKNPGIGNTTGTTKNPGTTTNKPGTTTTTTTKKTTTTTKSNITVNLGASDLEFFQNIVNTENAWLASTQLSNGALPMTPTNNGTATMNPYFADFAALSMLNQADKYASNVKKYMDWHFNHLNTAKTDYNGVDGTIYDYKITVSNGKVTGETITTNGNKKQYDSTDSYAATFLMVVQKYVEKTGDKAYAISHASEIERVVNAMYATMHNGLTLAKPDYAIKYLMDNCEVYGGMVAAEKLYTDVLVPAGAGSKTTRDKLKDGVKLISDNIEKKMWNGSYYYPALGTDDRSAYTFSWSNFYPSATSQMFPIIFDLLDPSSDRAKTLYNSFCQNYDWENHNIPDTFYWGSNVQAAAKMGDVNRMKTYLTAYQKVAMRNHNYPLYNADAAKVCMAAYDIIQMAG